MKHFQGVFDIMAVMAQEWIRADWNHGFGMPLIPLNAVYRAVPYKTLKSR